MVVVVAFGSQHCFREGVGAMMRSGGEGCLIRVHTIPGIEHEIRESPSPLGYSVGYLWQLGVPGASAAVVPAARANAGRAAQLGRGGGHCGHGVQLGLAGGPGGGRVGRPQRAGRAVHFACKRRGIGMSEWAV